GEEGGGRGRVGLATAAGGRLLSRLGTGQGYRQILAPGRRACRYRAIEQVLHRRAYRRGERLREYGAVVEHVQVYDRGAFERRKPPGLLWRERLDQRAGAIVRYRDDHDLRA